MTEAPLLVVRDLRVEQTAVKAVSFALCPGQSLAILGDRDSGAVDAAWALVGLTRNPAATISGQVVFAGEDLLTLSRERRRRLRGARIALAVPGGLDPGRSLGDQLGEAVRAHRAVSAAAARDRAVDLLEEVGVPEPQRAIDQAPRRLPPAVRARAMVALALAGDPELVIVIGPGAGLPLTQQAGILALCQELRRLALVLVTDEPGIAAELADVTAVMHGGEIVELGPTARILSAPRHPSIRELLESIPRLDRPRGPRRTIECSEPPIQIDLGGASVELVRGEALGVVGEGGGGIETVAERAVGHLSDAVIVADAEEPLNPFWTVDPQDPDATRRYPHDLAPVERQRAQLTLALADDPVLVIADEPLAGLSVADRATLLRLLDERTRGRALLFITGDLPAARQICDRVAVMYAGAIVELAAVDALFGHPRHPYSGALLSAVTVPDPAAGRSARQLLRGAAPGPSDRPPGCPFHPRCPKAQPICAQEPPALHEHREGNLVACHFPLTRAELGLG